MKPSIDKSPNYWAIVPAGGKGSRMSSEIPKQYLPLHNSTVIEQTLSRLARHPLIKGIVVAIAQDDKHWRALSVTLEKELIEAKSEG